MKTIAIWCEHSFQLYSAIPVINKYKKQHTVLVFTKKENLKSLEPHYKNSDTVTIISLDKYIHKPATLLKEFFAIFFVSENFSYVYKHAYVNKERFKIRILRKIFFLKIPSKYINKAYKKLNSIFFKKKSIDNFFDIDLIISFTKIYYAYLIPDNTKVPHINIMESWDHPIKFPYYIEPSFNLTWNKDLANDTKKNQYIKRVKKITPLKFRYLYEYQNQNDNELLNKIKNTPYYDEILALRGKKIILYPTTTSSAGLMHEGEMKFLDELCQNFRNTDYTLYIKPKPNAPKGDYDIFKKYENVQIGIYSNNKLGTDMLDENYHIFRYLLLKICHVLINTGTTFGLEAALADKRIIQLNLEKGKYLGFDEFCKTYHLKKYVLSIDGVLNFKNKENTLLNEINNGSNSFSKELKKWITNW